MTNAVIFLVIIFAWMASSPSHAQPAEPVRLILDTDLGPDSDDAGAMALMHALASRGEAEILAVMCSTMSPWCPPAADVINTYYRRPDIPIGAVKQDGPAGTSEGWPGDSFNGYLAGRFPNDLRHAEYAEHAVDLYRRILSAAPDTSIAIAATGTLSNLADLLQSPPDTIDGRSGIELIAGKVRLLSVMGGRYPSGGESNFQSDAAAAKHVVEHWPTDVTFSGFELGMDVLTGPRLYTETPADNPVRVAYHLWDLKFARRFTPEFNPQSGIWPHSSFDQTAVLYAVRGLHDYWVAESRGFNVVHEDGSNEWTQSDGSHERTRPAGNHAYLIEKMPRDQVARVIEELMVQPPDD